MVIERGQRCAARHDLRNAFQIGKQRQKRRLHFQHHFGTQCGDLLGVATEQQRIAHAQFAVQQYGATLQRLGTQPQRLLEISISVAVLR